MSDEEDAEAGPEIDFATGLPIARPSAPQYGDADYGQQGTKAEHLSDLNSKSSDGLKSNLG